MRIAQCRFKQAELLAGRFDRFRAQRDGNNWKVGAKILQMRVKHPKKKIDIICRLRNFENAFVKLFIAK